MTSTMGGETDWVDDELGHMLDAWLAPGSVDPGSHNVGPDGEPYGDCYKCRLIRDRIREYRDAQMTRADLREADNP